jgi:hypothetical protein
MVLNNVFTVTIPNDVFVRPLLTVNDDGSIFTNRSVEQVRIIAAPGEVGDAFILGRPFFSVVYLSVDYDASTFTLWRANATNNVDLVAFGGNCSTPAVNAPSNNSSAVGTGHQKTSKTKGGQHKGGLSSGTIAGIVVACTIFAAVVGAASTLWLTRQRKRLRELAKEDPSSGTGSQSAVRDSYGGPRFYEAMSNQIRELGAEGEPGELHAMAAPQELSTERVDRVRQKRMLQGLNSPVELG